MRTRTITGESDDIMGTSQDLQFGANRRGTRRTLRGAIVVALALLAVLVAAPAGFAAQVHNPGPFVAYISGGSLQIKTSAFNLGGGDNCPTSPLVIDSGCNPRILGNISSTGVISVTSVGFPPAVAIAGDNPDPLVHTDDTIATVMAVSPTSWSGTLDPLTGAATFTGWLRVQLTDSNGLTGVGSSCYVGGTSLTPGSSSSAIKLTMTSGTKPATPPGDAISGAPYDESTGNVLLADNTLAAPAASGCGLLGLGNSQVNTALGLPSDSGSNTASLQFTFDPKPLAPIRPAFSFSPDQARAPAPVSFDASGTTVLDDIGPITSYAWDYGDGGSDTTTDPTVSHTYQTPGVYTATMTATTHDGTHESVTHTVTVKGVVANITSSPQPLTKDTSATFAFDSSEADSYECSLDGAAFAACESPATYDGLAQGVHSFRVRGVDEIGAGLPTEDQWRIDTTPPVPSFTSGPAARSNSATESDLAFAATDNVTDAGAITFECRYDSAAAEDWQPCASPQHVQWPLTEATHTFDIRGTDEAGNVSAPVTRTWVVDLTPPTTSISGTPTNTLTSTPATVSNPTNQSGNTSSQFSFGTNEPTGATFVCKFDTGAERACQSPIQTGTGSGGTPSQTRLGAPVQGVNTFTVWAVDAAGNRDPNGQTYSYTYDTVQPTVTLFGTPSQYTNQTSFSVIASSSENIATTSAANPSMGWECSYANTASYQPCTQVYNSITATYQRSGLTQGTYTIRVRATDLAGNVSSSANIGTFAYTVDLTAPGAPTISAGPLAGSNTNDTSASFAFSATDTGGSPATGTTYQCRLDGATDAAYSACTSPKAYTGLSAGTHTFDVRAIDQAGNTGAATTRAWTVGTGSVTLDTKPSANSSAGAPATTGTAAFDFHSATGTDTFECRQKAGAAFVDTSGWAACGATGSGSKSYSGLAQGLQYFEVRTVSSDGLTKGFPTVYSWTVDTVKPVTTISSGPAARTDATTTQGAVAFSATDTNSPLTYECRYDSTDAGAWTPCASPQTVTWPITDNAVHTFDVRSTDPAGNVSAVVTRTWTVDATPPTPSVRWAGPAITSQLGSASGASANSFYYSSNESLVSTAAGFICQFNTAAERNCAAISGALATPGTESAVQTGTSSQSASGAFPSQTRIGTPVQGLNTLKVWAVDAAGNRSATPAVATFTYDTTQPTVTAVSPSTSILTNRTDGYTFVFTANERLDRFECSLNSTTSYSTCSGSNTGGTGTAATQTLAGPLSEGTYTVRVRGVDLATPANTSSGNNIATYNVVVDQTAPVVTITDGPAQGATVGGLAPAFSFKAGNEANVAGTTNTVSFECRLDSTDPADWAACGSSTGSGTVQKAYSGLAAGAHTLDVRATDGAGNHGDAVSRSWTIDTAAPVATITDHPDAATNSSEASFAFGADKDGSTFECRLDSTDDADWQACAAPQDYSDLAEGTHTFELRATDTLGNVGDAATRSWTVDQTAPTAAIDTHPPALTDSSHAGFAFSSDEDGSTFECRLDSGDDADWQPCDASPEYRDLAAGDHTLEVRATDPSGNTGESVGRTWTVDLTAPTMSIDSGPSADTTETGASLRFSSDDDAATFECRIDGGDFAACTSIADYSGLSVGTHTFQVRATDAAGNTSEPATRSWAVVPVPADVATDAGGPTSTSPTTTIPPTTTTPPPTTTMPPPGGSQKPGVSSLTLLPTSSSVLGTLAVPLKCAGAAATCSGKVRIVTTVMHGKKKVTVTIGSASYSVAGGKTGALKVKLTAAGRKLIRAAAKKGLKVEVTLTPKGAKKPLASRTITLKQRVSGKSR